MGTSGGFGAAPGGTDHRAPQLPYGVPMERPPSKTPPQYPYGVPMQRPQSQTPPMQRPQSQTPPNSPMGSEWSGPNHRPPPVPLWGPNAAAPITDPPQFPYGVPMQRPQSQTPPQFPYGVSMVRPQLGTPPLPSPLGCGVGWLQNGPSPLSPPPTARKEPCPGGGLLGGVPMVRRQWGSLPGTTVGPQSETPTATPMGSQ